MVLGGAHGNEPGAWLAADQMTDWEPASGDLLILPRANVRAIERYERLVDDEGDLNRQYPGDPKSKVAMSRLAAEITSLAREYQIEALLDLHESWAFFVDRRAAGIDNTSPGGTAFLGQTITSGRGPRSDQLARQITEAVNSVIPRPREQFVARGGGGLTPSPGATLSAARGRSSLVLGDHVPGLTPVLVETGQEGQLLERRIEMQLSVVRAAMDILGM